MIFSEQSVSIEDQTYQDIFLLLDEVPCNSDPGFDDIFYGRPSGDWKGLKKNGINLMMALKPVGASGFKGIFAYLLNKIMSRKTAIDLCFPEDIAHLQLSRIYRCTKNIAELYEGILAHINKPNQVNYGINSSSILYSPGHEIHGDNPEVLLLPRCNCFDYCKIPVEHLLHANKTKILAMLKRIQSKFTALEVTVLIETLIDNQKCGDWMKRELKKETFLNGNIVFKTIEQCRGVEFPVLMTISDGSKPRMTPTTLDTWTRVTVSLFIIQMDEEYSAVSRGLKNCLKKQIAKQSEEQEKIKYNFLRKLYFSLQSPLFLLISSSLIIVTALVFIILMGYVVYLWFICGSCVITRDARR